VTAECGGDDVGIVDATSDSAGEWQTFYVRVEGGGNVSIRSSHGRNVSAELGGGEAVHANRTAVGPWELFHLDGSLVDGASIALRAPDGAHSVPTGQDLTPPIVEATAPVSQSWEQFTVHVLVTPIHQRHGIVHADGRSFVDDDGAFYPLGATLFWAL